MSKIEFLTDKLKGLGVSRVSMRYHGAEGLGLVKQVNFLTQSGKFLSHREIHNLKIPDDEICKLAEDALSVFKYDWADDWGGVGEIIWDLCGEVTLCHEDRKVIAEDASILINVLDFPNFISALSEADVNISEVAISAKFVIEDGVTSWEAFEITNSEETDQDSNGLQTVVFEHLSSIMNRVAEAEKVDLNRVDDGNISINPDGSSLSLKMSIEVLATLTCDISDLWGSGV